MKIKKLFAAFLAGIILTCSICTSGTQAQKSDFFPEGPSPSSLSSNSAIVMELSTGTVLYEKNIHKHHYPASITKIMTTLLALEHCSLSEVMTITEEEVYGIEPGSSSIYSVPGEKFTVEQSLYAIMLESSNETCLMVADHVAGSKKKFADMMNAKAKELGLSDTHFTNPNGLHDDDHYTSAYDMACIAREAWKNKTFQKICGTKRYTLESTNKRKESQTWLNHHQMLNGYDWPKYEYKYCIGGKTGYTMMAQSTLVTFAEKDGMQLVCVIMKGASPRQGEPNEYTDSTNLLNYGFENYKKYIVNKDNSSVNENLFNTFDSYFDADASPVHLAEESAVILPKGVPLKKAKQTITYDTTKELTEGENVIGQVTYSYKGRTVGSTDILYDNSKNSTYLDQASRNIVSEEIQQIETKNAHKTWIGRKISALTLKIANKFTKIADFFRGKSILLIALGLVLLLIILLVLNALSDTRGRRRRSSGRRLSLKSGNSISSSPGISFNRKRFRSRRGADYISSRRTGSAERKSERSSSFSMNSRRQRHKDTAGSNKNRAQSNFSMRSRRQRRRSKPEKTGGPEKSSFSMNSRKKKNSRRTRESFGKNFFDF